MRGLKKMALLAGALALCACASYRNGQGTGTEGTSAEKRVDCSTVRCAACPTGQHPILKPPDCCKCVPD
jgi:hypothetical protein